MSGVLLPGFHMDKFHGLADRTTIGAELKSPQRPVADRIERVAFDQQSLSAIFRIVGHVDDASRFPVSIVDQLTDKAAASDEHSAASVDRHRVDVMREIIAGELVDDESRRQREARNLGAQRSDAAQSKQNDADRNSLNNSHWSMSSG